MSTTILLADDSLTIQKVVELTFADSEFEVVSTSSGDELLEKLPGATPDVIICDTIMPGSDGYLVCQKIKSEPATLHIPVILLTGTFEPFDRDRALAAGCSEIITKPFEARRLVETVERLVSGEEAAAPAPAEPEEGAVAPPEFAGAVSPPPTPPQEGVEFGTVLSTSVTKEGIFPDDQPPEEGLDFTSTGFAEMEEAGELAGISHNQAPDHGLDYDPPTDAGPFGDSNSEESKPMTMPEVPFEEPAEEVTQPIEPFDPDEDIFDEEPTTPVAEDGDPSFDDDDTVADAPEVEQPDSGELISENAGEEPEPFDPPVFEAAQDFEFGEQTEDSVGEADTLGEVDDLEVVEETDQIDEVAEVEAVPAIPPMPTPEPGIEKTAPIGELSDLDVDRIARRVVELAADRLEQIAWEVIPDMAEIVVRERIRELETEVEKQADAPAN